MTRGLVWTAGFERLFSQNLNLKEKAERNDYCAFDGEGREQIHPGKNVYPVLGRPLVHYPMTAAFQSRMVDAVYVSTDCPEIMRLARQIGVNIIDRPKELAQDDTELTDVILHAMEVIEEDFEVLVTMHCNCAVHRPGIIDEAIEVLRSRPDADSCVSGFTERSVHPFRTKKLGQDGCLHNWMSVPANTSNNRQKLDPCFILDGACRAIRVERCFPPDGQPPFPYLGNRILPLGNLPGGDVHSEADCNLAEFHLRKLGWQEAKYPQKR